MKGTEKTGESKQGREVEKREREGRCLGVVGAGRGVGERRQVHTT